MTDELGIREEACAVSVSATPRGQFDWRVRVLDVVTEADDIARVLGDRGHARAPPRRPATRQIELDFGAV